MKTFLAYALLTLFPLVGFSESTPESAFNAYFSDLKKLDLTNAAKHMHSDELVKFKSMMLPVFTSIPKDQSAQIFSLFNQFKDAEDAKSQTPVMFFKSFLLSVDNMKPGFLDALKSMRYRIIGSVYEEESNTYHVVYRIFADIEETMEFSKVAAQPISKEGDEYKLMLTGEIKGMAQALKNAFSK